MSRFDTTRGRLQLERAKEMIKFWMFVVLMAALLITCMVSCSRCDGCSGDGCSCGGDDTSGTDTVVEEKYVDREALRDVASYPRLINATNLLSPDYEPPELTYLRGMPDGTTIQMNFDAATAFTKLYQAMLEDGMAIIPLSGYRTYQEQLDIYEYNIKLHIAEGMSEEAAREYTLRFVALPGTSEHQYGRSIDVTIDGTTNHSFQKTDQGKWLIEHAHEFGFVLRYPEDKEDITGIAYEPWHLRYVGLETADYMHKYDLCLEEYVSYVKIENPYAYSEP